MFVCLRAVKPERLPRAQNRKSPNQHTSGGGLVSRSWSMKVIIAYHSRHPNYQEWTVHFYKLHVFKTLLMFSAWELEMKRKTPERRSWPRFNIQIKVVIKCEISSVRRVWHEGSGRKTVAWIQGQTRTRQFSVTCFLCLKTKQSTWIWLNIYMSYSADWSVLFNSGLITSVSILSALISGSSSNYNKTTKVKNGNPASPVVKYLCRLSFTGRPCWSWQY